MCVSTLLAGFDCTGVTVAPALPAHVLLPTHLSLSRLGGGRLKRYEGFNEHATLDTTVLLPLADAFVSATAVASDAETTASSV